MKKNRELNIELLRCVLMLFVVGLHVIGNGILSNKNPIAYGSLNFYLGNLLESFFIMSVNCYVLISGYFGIRASFEKLLKLYLPILFYSIFLYFIVSVIFNIGFSIKDIYFIIPFIAKKYWFVSSYILLFLLSPLLNKILNNITKFQLQASLVIGIFLFILVPTFTPFSFEMN